MPIVNVTWLGWSAIAIVAYYAFLLLVQACRQIGRRSSRSRSRSRAAADRRDPFIVLVIPAHNEQEVLGQTLCTLEALDYPDRLVLVMDDGSSDATSQIAESFVFSGRISVVRRHGEISGKGKGSVLNHAFTVISRMVSDSDPRLQGRSADDVVIGVMDADGQLEADALSKVAPYFTGRHNRRVGGVQIGVRIANAATNLITRMQDMEFVGFSALVQDSRNGLGSVGLGGNGQFTRLSALEALGRDPWTNCLSEDLDLSLSLAEAGWSVRYCPDTFVAQQGLTRMWPLLRQRARWIQGHYQCWRHLPTIWSSDSLAWRAKADLSAYLTMILFIFVISTGLVVSVLGLAGVVMPVNTSLDAISNPYLHNVVELLLSVGPLAAFVVVYQMRAASRLRWWELFAVAALFTVYASVVWAWGQAWAWSRMVRGRGSWAKTPRVRAEIAVQIVPAGGTR